MTCLLLEEGRDPGKWLLTVDRPPHGVWRVWWAPEKCRVVGGFIPGKPASEPPSSICADLHSQAHVCGLRSARLCTEERAASKTQKTSACPRGLTLCVVQACTRPSGCAVHEGIHGNAMGQGNKKQRERRWRAGGREVRAWTTRHQDVTMVTGP